MPGRQMTGQPAHEKLVANRDDDMASKTQHRTRGRGLIGMALLAAALAGCASSDAAKKALNPDPPGKMYADADALMNAGRYDDAAQKFEDLDRDHPYAPEARRAIVMAGYAYYRAGKNPEAIAAARRYTTLHPGTKDAALAHHIVASAYFADIKDPTLDQTPSRRALAELKILVTRYPESPYAKQAENRIRIAEDSLAAAEMNVGRQYLKKGHHIAAINRFKVVVSDYQTTQHVEEALYRLAESNMSLGIRNEAQTAVAVLGHNYPNSRWYKDGYALLQREGLKPQENSGSWISQQIRKITPGSPAKPSSSPAAVPDSAPGPVPVPVERTPAEDIPTASTTRTKPMGLTSTN
ncbi:MAG TPA: outer membrane protein assembly factor BamD [Hyphomicrobiaceae bacterium]|nr:outer membrane protein assembly factor BamD [Hyphomicrobiaceae bacterium]